MLLVLNGPKQALALVASPGGTALLTPCSPLHITPFIMLIYEKLWELLLKNEGSKIH